MRYLKTSFLLIIPFLLTSCDGDSQRIYQQEKITGDLYFQDVIAMMQSNKKVVLSYKDLVCESSSIKNNGGTLYTTEHETSSWIGVKTKTTHHWYIFDVKLNEEDQNKMSNVFRKLLDEQIEILKGRGVYQGEITVLDYDVTGVALGEVETKVDGKYEQSNYYVYAKLGNSFYYNGNGSYTMAPEIGNNK